MDTITTRQSTQTPQHYGCFAAGWPLLLQYNPDCELRRKPTIHPQPHSSAVFPGLIEYGGWPLPLFDLQSVANPDPPGDYSTPDQTWVIVWGRGRDAFGLRLDNSPVAVTDLRLARSPQTLPNVIESCLKSVFSTENQYWLVIDPVRLGRQLSRLASIHY